MVNLIEHKLKACAIPEIRCTLPKESMGILTILPTFLPEISDKI